MRGRGKGLQNYGQGFGIFTRLLIGWFAGIASITIVITCVGGVSLALAT